MRTRIRIIIILFSMVVLLCITGYGYAAVYVKGNHHFDSYYSNGVLHPESDQVNEWWCDKDKVSFVTPDWRLTLDKQKKRIIAVNRREKTYTEIPLPLEISSHLDQSLIEILKDYQMEGTIKTTGKKETVDQKVCDIYEVSEGIIYQKNRFYDRDRTIKITDDVSLDWRLLEELHQWIRSYFNPQKSYLSDLEKLHGFVLASRDVQINQGIKVIWDFNVMEISRKQAPPDTFTIPGDFKKKDKLSREDLIGIRGTLYIYP